MKKTYIIPVQRWAIMEENFLQSVSTEEALAAQSEGMDVKAQYNWDNADGGKTGGNVWDSEW